MADLSEIPIVRDSDSVDVVAPDVQRVDASFEEEEYGGGDGIGEEEVVNYEDDMFEIDEDGGEEEYEDDYEAQFLALQVCSLHTNQIRQSGGCKAPPLIFGTMLRSAFFTTAQNQGLCHLFLTLSWDLHA